MTAPLPDSGRNGPARFLAPGDTCWRVEPAERAALLIDGADYFAALRSAMLKARRSIFIIGWDIDSRAPLRAAPGGGVPNDDPEAPERLGELLEHVAARRPEINVRLLLWNYSILYAVERELLPALSLGWQTPPQVAFCFDDRLPLGASHHQKLAVIDDAVAFCGGIDLTSRRWDRSAHDPDDPDRVDPAGKRYPPFHDMQMVVDGAAARALGELARERWCRASTVPAPPVADVAGGDPWPTGVAADFEGIGVGIARTLPALDDREAVREVEALYLRAIAMARKRIYVENQYLTTDRIAEALCARLRDRPELEVVIVGPEQPKGWLEAKTMGAGRLRFRRCLEAANVFDRVRMMYPFVGAGSRRTTVMVHAKAMIVDDDLLRVGSANLNNRSMGFDSECDLAIEARDDADRRVIAGLRDRMLAEHLGVEPADVAAAMRERGSLLAIVDTLGRADRGLAPIRDSEGFDTELGRTITPLADPEQPIEPDALMGGVSGVAPARRRFGRMAAVAVAAGLLAGLALLWQFTPLADLLAPERLAPQLDSLAGSAWAPLAVMAAFVIGGFVVFPVTVLIALTAMTFGPWQGFIYAAAGALLSAAATHQAGRLVRRRWLRGLMGPRIERVSQRLGKQGVISVVLLRVVPVAPFTFVNLVAGASQIRFRDYMLGTVLGMAPGIVLMTALGDRLRNVWQDPTWAEIGLLAAVIAVWIGVSLALQRAVSRRRR